MVAIGKKILVISFIASSVFIPLLFPTVVAIISSIIFIVASFLIGKGYKIDKARYTPNLRIWRQSFLISTKDDEETRVAGFKESFERQTPKSYAKFLRTWNATLISKSKRGTRLYEIAGVFNKKKLKMLRYKDPSTQQEYLCFVPENIRDADEAMAWKFYLTEEEYDGIIQEA